MQTKIAPNLYVGNGTAGENAIGKKGWSVLSAAKEFHKEMCGYTSYAAPKNAEYLVARRDNHMCLNLVDSEDVNYISKEAIDAGLAFINERLNAGDKVLIHCSHGHSRSPSIGLLYLASLGLLPHSYEGATRKFRRLYPEFAPNSGMRQYIQKALPNLQ